MNSLKPQNTFAIPKDDCNKEAWLRNFANKLPLFALRYDITREDLLDMKTSAKFYSYWHNVHVHIEKLLNKVAGFKAEARMGSVDYLSPALTAPMLNLSNGKTPKPVDPGIFIRADRLINKILDHKDYNTNDGYYLGMGSFQPLDASSKIKPYINVELNATGHPEIKWERLQTDALELSVDRGEGYCFMGKVCSGLVTDNALLPENKTAVWKYKGIYRKFDKQVGFWSKEIGITVGIIKH